MPSCYLLEGWKNMLGLLSHASGCLFKEKQLSCSRKSSLSLSSLNFVIRLAYFLQKSKAYSCCVISVWYHLREEAQESPTDLLEKETLCCTFVSFSINGSVIIQDFGECLNQTFCRERRQLTMFCSDLWFSLRKTKVWVVPGHPCRADAHPHTSESNATLSPALRRWSTEKECPLHIECTCWFRDMRYSFGLSEVIIM